MKITKSNQTLYQSPNAASQPSLMSKSKHIIKLL